MSRFASVVFVLTLALCIASLGQDKTGTTASSHPAECLIVTSAEGHRFRNSMIAGALTGGIGLAAGAAFSGGRYEYRDSFNVPASEIKTKYKGPELQKLEQEGVHVVVVNKKDTTGSEVASARASCQSMITPTPAPAAPMVQPSPQASPSTAPAVQAPAQGSPTTAPVQTLMPTPVATTTSVPAPSQAKAPVCLATVVDNHGNETCTKFSQKQ
jgi:hypothetical protein